MRFRPFVFAGLIVVAGVGHAAEEFIYTVQAGDHPWNIAQRYLRDTSDALRLTRLNRITNDRTVPPGTRLRIPAQWLKLETTAVRLMALHGEATITQGNGSSRPARSGEDVGPGHGYARGSARASCCCLTTGPAC